MMKIDSALLLSTATTFTIWEDPTPHDHDQIDVVRAKNALTGKYWWKVVHRSFTLNRAGEFEYEPFPSNRSDAYLKRTRWTKLETAYRAGLKAAKKMAAEREAIREAFRKQQAAKVKAA